MITYMLISIKLALVSVLPPEEDQQSYLAKMLAIIHWYQEKACLAWPSQLKSSLFKSKGVEGTVSTHRVPEFNALIYGALVVSHSLHANHITPIVNAEKVFLMSSPLPCFQLFSITPITHLIGINLAIYALLLQDAAFNLQQDEGFGL